MKRGTTRRIGGLALLLLALFAVFGHEPSHTRQWSNGLGATTLTPHAFMSGERRALRGFDDASDIEILSLDPNSDIGTVAAMEDPKRCPPGACLQGNRILGRVRAAPGDQAALATTLGGWLHDEPDFAAACEPAFRHAIAWREGDGERTVLLCYSCGIYRVLVDGEVDHTAGFPGGYGQGGSVEGDALLNARLRAAGIRYYDNDVNEWVDPPGGASAP